MTQIRKATIDDLTSILRVYTAAQDYMIETGNPTQWGHRYPDKTIVEEDIHKGECHVLCDEDGVRAVSINVIMSRWSLRVSCKLQKQGGLFHVKTRKEKYKTYSVRGCRSARWFGLLQDGRLCLGDMRDSIQPCGNDVVYRAHRLMAFVDHERGVLLRQRFM